MHYYKTLYDGMQRSSAQFQAQGQNALEEIIQREK